VPDLAIEVVSPSNLANEVLKKTKEYYRTGVEPSWAIYPAVAELYDYDSPV
jgi:Uma2 family endonuclease